MAYIIGKIGKKAGVNFTIIDNDVASQENITDNQEGVPLEIVGFYATLGMPKKPKASDEAKCNEHDASPYTCMDETNKKRFTFKEGNAFCLQGIITQAVGEPQKGDGAQKFSGAQKKVNSKFFDFLHGEVLSFLCK